jgi:hypothetical protein
MTNVTGIPLGSVAGTLALANGGTSASLTASIGGVPYSTASALAILAGTAIANLPLLSGSSAAPAWAGISYPTSATSGGVPYFSSTSAMGSSPLLAAGGAAGSAKQIAVSGGAASPTFIDFPDVQTIYAAACTNGSGATALWNLPSSSAMVAGCRAGFYGNLGAIPGSTDTAYFEFHLPSDWDTGQQPYVRIYFGSGTNSSSTNAIFTLSDGCSSADGSVTDNPTLSAETSMTSGALSAATRGWAVSQQLSNITSGNNCLAGSTVKVKVVVTGTATAAVSVEYAVITTPRLLTVQAN